jgi:hypothetical protein
MMVQNWLIDLCYFSMLYYLPIFYQTTRQSLMVLVKDRGLEREEEMTTPTAPSDLDSMRHENSAVDAYQVDEPPAQVV